MGELSHSPSRIITQLLINLSIGSDPEDDDDWPIYYSRMPDGTDNCIAVYDTTPQNDAKAMTDGEVFEHFGIQIRLRHTSYDSGFDKIRNEIGLLLDAVKRSTVTIGTTSYRVGSVTKRSGPFPIGNDPKTGRLLFTMNAVTTIQQIT